MTLEESDAVAREEQKKIKILTRRSRFTEGYLSRLLAQAGNPSSALVLLLGLIAKDPQARLSEVQAYCTSVAG